jgi:hypothetical protein
MKRFQWAIAILVVTGAQCVYADSVTLNLTGASILIFPNLSGDNTAFNFIGPGVSISGGGSAVCDNWCNAGLLFPAGSRLTPDVDLLGFAFSQGTVRIGGRTESVATLFNSSITSSGFIFPTNGKKVFTVSLFAFIPEIRGITETGEVFNLEMPRAKLRLTFVYNPFGNGYEFSKGKFTAGVVPEPGTLGLMGSGLAGIIGAILRKRGCKSLNKP